MGDIAFFVKQSPEQIFDQFRNWFAINNVTGCDSQVEQFASIIEDSMQFEAIETAGRTLASLGEFGKDLVLLDPQVMTYNDGYPNR